MGRRGSGPVPAYEGLDSDRGTRVSPRACLRLFTAQKCRQAGARLRCTRTRARGNRCWCDADLRGCCRQSGATRDLLPLLSKQPVNALRARALFVLVRLEVGPLISESRKFCVVWRMKNPAPPTEVWSPLHRERGETPSSKKFKRKSREPKRLLSTAAPPLDLSDVDSSEDTLMGTRYVSKLAPLHRQLMVSKDMSEEAGAQSRALDMRTCSNGPVLGAKAPPFSLSTQEISHWPPSISQPLSGRLKLGPPSSFPAGSGFPHQVFPMEPSPPRQPGVRTHPSPPSPQCLDHIEAPLLSPKVSVKLWVKLCLELQHQSQNPHPLSGWYGYQ